MQNPIIRHSKAYSLLVACLLIATGASADSLALASKLPAQDAAAFETVCAELMKDPATSVKTLCAKLVPPGTGDDTEARLALNGLAKYVTREGAEKERVAYCKALVEFLPTTENREITAFVIRQLQRAGRDEAVPALAAHLAQDELCEPAAQALVGIGTPLAVTELANALADSSGNRTVTIIQSLGRCRHTRSEKTIAGYLDSEDAATSDAALYALANMGSSLAEKPLETRMKQTSGNARSIAAALYLDLAAQMRSRTVARMCNEVIDTCDASNDTHIVCAALDLLTRTDPKSATKALRNATETNDRTLANKVYDLASSHLESKDASSIIDRLAEKDREYGMKYLALRSRDGDKEAAEELAAAITDEDADTRSAAMPYALALPPTQSTDALLAATAMGHDTAPVTALLLRLDNTTLSTKARQVFKDATDPERIVMLGIVKQRHLQELREQVLAQLSHTTVDVRIAALGALTRVAIAEDTPALLERLFKAEDATEQAAAQNAVVSLGGPALLTRLAVFTKHEGDSVRDTAVRALCQWKTDEAVTHLLDLAKSTDKLTHHVLALRSCVRLANESKKSPKERLAIYRSVLETAKRPEEKREVIAALAGIKAPGSVSVVAPYLDNDALKSAAAVTIGKLVAPDRRYRGMSDEASAVALHKATPLVTDKALQKRMAAHLKKIYVAPEKPGTSTTGDFVPLFNGRDLSGWTGAVNGHVVEDGALVCTKSAKGTLFTDAQYDDFVLRFKFKLTKGANNGLAIRAPLKGNPAYAGMELQVIDNVGYPHKLKDWQKHGSIYNVVPAKTGCLKPVGEWNEQEVVADGRRISVTLNGTVIVDANLDEYTEEHGARHPGLSRMRGHIGFMSHGARVEFKDIAIRSIDRQVNTPPTGFTALFNGKDFTNWRGLMKRPLDNPVKRAALSPEERTKHQQIADDYFEQHWSVKDGILHFDGKGSSAATVKQYADFEMYCDWKIRKGGDSGIYLRGTPQVQIWDRPDIGSGGLYNNKENPSKPLCVADSPVGQWNTFHIKMIGDKVTVFLNGKLIVDNVVLENYWARDKPIFPQEQIELQCHGHPLEFRNIFIREW